MSAEQPPPPDPWRELSRRRVVRVAALYAAVAFALLEGSAIALPMLDAPEWGLRFVLGAFVLAFPPAMVLAWRYDVTPSGIVKTPDDEPPESDVTEQPWRWITGVVVATLIGVVLESVR